MCIWYIKVNYIKKCYTFSYVVITLAVYKMFEYM